MNVIETYQTRGIDYIPIITFDEDLCSDYDGDSPG